MPRPDEGEPRKIAYLDGLRGVAAFTVLSAHLMIALFPGVITFLPREVRTPYDIALGVSPLRALFSGNFAVCVFFVLSGFVLSDFCVHARISFPAQLVRRYFRLALPMLVTSSFAWLLLALHLYKNLDASTVTHSGWLSAWYRFDANLWLMAREALVNAFTRGRADYNSNLWTMRLEIIGSIYIFVLHALARNRAIRLAAILVYVGLYPWEFNDLFLVGALLYDWRARIDAPQRGLWLDRGVREILAAAAFVVGLWAGSFPELQPGMQSPWHAWLTSADNSVAWHMVAAVITVAALLNTVFVQGFFRTRPVVFLGKISFVLYLIHLPIICSLTAWIVWWMQGAPYAALVAVAWPLTVAAVLLVSVAVYRYADLNMTSFSRRAGRAVDRWFPVG